jgi:hypothetical protein
VYSTVLNNTFFSRLEVYAASAARQISLEQYKNNDITTLILFFIYVEKGY